MDIKYFDLNKAMANNYVPSFRAVNHFVEYTALFIFKDKAPFI